MTRVLLALALLALASTSAFAKPKVAILGLEVTGVVDQAGTNVARDLTDGMRARAKGGNGPYTLAPNSDRELIDEKVIKQCETEDPGCMSEIGRDIDADVLVYGKLEKDGGGFQATINMLDVKKKTNIKTTFVAVPPGAGSDAVRNLAKKTYLELAPSAATGTAKLVITANVERGNVLVDDELRETLSDGRATLTLPEGRYRIAIESDGYKRKELTVKLVEDDRATESFELTKLGKGGGGGGEGFDPWKPIFGITALAAVGFGSYSVYALIRAKDAEISPAEKTIIQNNRPGMTPGDVTESDCVDANLGDPGIGKSFKESCTYNDRNRTFAYVGGAVGVVALVAGYFAFIREGKHAPESTAQRHARRPAMAITPTFAPGGGGASLRIDW